MDAEYHTDFPTFVGFVFQQATWWSLAVGAAMILFAFLLMLGTKVRDPYVDIMKVAVCGGMLFLGVAFATQPTLLLVMLAAAGILAAFAGVALLLLKLMKRTPAPPPAQARGGKEMD